MVEDESGLRKLMSKVLEKQDCRVLEAKDGEEALSICQDNLAHIDLVVTDYAMPRMTGLQLKEKVAAYYAKYEIPPYFRVCRGSGGRHLQQGLNGGDFLEKPFLPDELARKVREMLSRTIRKHGEEDSHSANTSSEQLSDELDSGTSHG